MTRPQPQIEPTAVDVRDVAWDDFVAWWDRNYRQDEHVSILGPSGSGKTHLARELLEAREFVIAFASKPEDPLVDRFAEYGYRVQERLDIPTAESKTGQPVPFYRRIVLWPNLETDPETGRRRSIPEMIPYQRARFREAFEYARANRRWTIFADDALYLADDLDLDTQLKWFWRMGRSGKMTLMMASQRPAWLPREGYSSPEHLFFFATNDKDDLERLRDIGAGFDKRPLQAAIANLRRHEFLYLAPRRFPPLLIRSKVSR